jgi:glutamine cyclotransferase
LSKQKKSAPPPRLPARGRGLPPIVGVLGLVAVASVVWLLWALWEEQPPAVYGYEVVKSYPHDPDAWTQGLAIDGGQLYEGTGMERESTLRRVELATGKVIDQVRLDDELFGEGIAILGDEIFQLTWKHGVCFVYDKKMLKRTRELHYKGEGWGLTHDGKHLILSDGTATLRFLDPKDFREVRRVEVTHPGRPLAKLNELEYVKGEVLANVWYTDRIARIDPKTGRLTGWIDLTGLLRRRPHEDAVLNGIAHDAKADRLFVTGKDWPRLFEIRIKERR